MILPQRIVSLVPSQTELLYDLGLGDRVVGITKFCVHPAEWYHSKTRIGGTKTVNIPKVMALNPDLIIANKEENDREQVDALATHCPVWTTDVKNLEDALEMIFEAGKRTGTTDKALEIIEKIKTGFDKLAEKMAQTAPVSAAYLIWRKPYMAAGGDTFIHDMMTRAGYSNVFANQNRYPECPADVLTALKPSYVLLSSEPFPFSETHIAEIQEICPAATIKIVDGEMFSWYGSRLVRAAEYLVISF